MSGIFSIIIKKIVLTKLDSFITVTSKQCLTYKFLQGGTLDVIIFVSFRSPDLSIRESKMHLSDVMKFIQFTEGAHEVYNYRNTVDFIANYLFTGEVFHEITILCLRDVFYSTNTEQKLLKLPYHRPQNR